MSILALYEERNIFERNWIVGVPERDNRCIAQQDFCRTTVVCFRCYIIPQFIGIDEIPIFVMTSLELDDILNNNPKWWGTENKEIYDNLIFIIPPTKYEDVYNTIGEPKEDIEKIKKYNDSIFWSYDLKNYRKSNWWNKTASTNISDKITIRTANTMKKVLEICKR